MSTMNTDDLIRLTNLNKHYGPVHVLKDVSLDVKLIVWRSNAPVATVIPPKAAKTEVADESLQLRTKLAELTSAMESQSRQAYDAGFAAGDAGAGFRVDPLEQPCFAEHLIHVSSS